MIERRKKETFRYMGIRSGQADEQMEKLADDVWEKLLQIEEFRVVSARFPLVMRADNRICIGIMDIASRDLTKNLQGCAEVIFLAATLGSEVDREIRRYSLTETAKAVAMQAASAAFLEEKIDGWQDAIGEELKSEGLFLRPRFSPGYGDFSICHQREFLQMLDAPKKIGLGVTEGNVLSPIKSVTALTGLSNHDLRCPARGCESCGMKNCAYRRS